MSNSASFFYPAKICHFMSSSFLEQCGRTHATKKVNSERLRCFRMKCVFTFMNSIFFITCFSSSNSAFRKTEKETRKVNFFLAVGEGFYGLVTGSDLKN